MNNIKQRKTGTVVFFDLVGFSTNSNPAQAEIAQEFMNSVKDALTRLWGSPPEKNHVNTYNILPTGDGAAVVIWGPARDHQTIENTALWIAGYILAWGSTRIPGIGIRCGINHGEMYLISDPYDQSNVCGSAINVAARIMDAARPGQLLASTRNFVSNFPHETLNTEELQFTDVSEPCEILVKHDDLLTVQSVVGKIAQGSKWVEFGIKGSPQDKWHLQIEPPSLSFDEFGIKQIKKPPAELIREHKRIAFVGVTNDGLPNIFNELLNEDSGHIWEHIEVYFLADKKLELLAYQDRTADVLVKSKNITIQELKQILYKKCHDGFQFYEFDEPLYFASYWDWTSPGGRIHVSPYIWGSDIKKCPGFDFIWKTKEPTVQYKAYMKGLENLRARARKIRG